MNKFYITTAIDYINGTIHMGHIFQKVVADVLARYNRIKLGDDNVFFLTGTDEYGHRAEQAAKEAGLDIREYADQISASDKAQQDSINISYDRFIRTTDPDHTKVVQEFWKKVEKSGDIYLGEYSGLYCPGCEAYYSAEDLANGCCPYHPNLEIKKITEQNYFFKWSKYRDFLVDHIKNNPDFVVPEARKNEMLQFAKNIKDIPISRSNFKWGIPVPGNSDQVCYVWFDALINYITGVGFLESRDLFDKFWPADVHILGKDNARWHALLWPAMLKSAGIKLPKTILVNGFINLNGQKISKSLGNVIRPSEWAEKYGVDAVRYYLLRYTTVTEDSDISEDKLIQAYNSDLANGLGNLVARVAKLLENNHLSFHIDNTDLSSWFIDPKIGAKIDEYKLSEALNIIWDQIREADKLINEKKPWEFGVQKLTDMTNPNAIELHDILDDLWTRIIHITYNLQPFLPETSEKILKQFTGEVKSQPPLFPRI